MSISELLSKRLENSLLAVKYFPAKEYLRTDIVFWTIFSKLVSRYVTAVVADPFENGNISSIASSVYSE